MRKQPLDFEESNKTKKTPYNVRTKVYEHTWSNDASLEPTEYTLLQVEYAKISRRRHKPLQGLYHVQLQRVSKETSVNECCRSTNEIFVIYPCYCSHLLFPLFM